MQFDPMSMFHEQTGEQLYGAGVAFGDALKFATARTPKNAKPALFGLSFDGGGSGVSNRTVYPICVSVLNCDGADPLQCGLVGFLPLLDVPPSLKSTNNFFLAKAHVMQECIGAIIDELENVSRSSRVSVVRRVCSCCDSDPIASIGLQMYKFWFAFSLYSFFLLRFGFAFTIAHAVSNVGVPP